MKLPKLFFILTFGILLVICASPLSYADNNLSELATIAAKSAAAEKSLAVKKLAQTAEFELNAEHSKQIDDFFTDEYYLYYSKLAAGEEPAPIVTQERDSKLQALLGDKLFEDYKKNQIDEFLAAMDQANESAVSVLGETLQLSPAQKLQARVLIVGMLQEIEDLPSGQELSANARAAAQQKVLIERFKPILTEEQLNRLIQFDAEDSAGEVGKDEPELILYSTLVERLKLTDEQKSSLKQAINKTEGEVKNSSSFKELVTLDKQALTQSKKLQELHTLHSSFGRNKNLTPEEIETRNHEREREEKKSEEMRIKRAEIEKEIEQIRDSSLRAELTSSLHLAQMQTLELLLANKPSWLVDSYRALTNYSLQRD